MILYIIKRKFSTANSLFGEAFDCSHEYNEFKNVLKYDVIHYQIKFSTTNGLFGNAFCCVESHE